MYDYLVVGSGLYGAIFAQMCIRDRLMKMGTDKQLVEMSCGIIENDRVQIVSGPLTGMEGSIRRIDRHKRIAHLEIEMFGRTVEMKVGLEIIIKE